MVMGDMETRVELLVIGAGPGGYTAAFRGADLGLDVALVDPRPLPGGSCLHEGCISAKTSFFLARLLRDAARAHEMGVHFEQPRIDLERLRAWKDNIAARMSEELIAHCEKRSIQRIAGRAVFESPTVVRLEGGEINRIRFKQAIIATGSQPGGFPAVEGDGGDFILTPEQALAFREIPEKFMILGGGYVALELGYIYAALGSNVHLVAGGNRLLQHLDEDLVAPLHDNLSELFAGLDLQTTPTSLKITGGAVEAELATPAGAKTLRCDKVLVARGRRPSSDGLGLENTGITTDDDGIISTDDSQQTTEKAIFAVGDVCGKGHLAHTAMLQGRVAAEAAAGKPAAYDVRAVPSVVYTDPQIAWCGLTERQAREQGLDIRVETYPWKHSGRAISMGAGEGLTKIIADPESGRLLGVGICGRDAENLIAEGVLAIESGALAEDIALSLHPHPSFSETLGKAAGRFLGW